jgi:hypothetical protein
MPRKVTSTTVELERYDMSHDKSPFEQALDLAVFGPLGLVMTAKDALPGWVDKGRDRLGRQVAVAKLVGEHASRHGQKVITGALVDLGVLPGPPPPTPRASERTGDGAGAGGAVRSVESTNGRPPGVGAAAPPPPRVANRPAAAGVAGRAIPGRAVLAIPGYDSLSASQVVQRLAGLAAPELEAVRTYESAGRGRRTILTKIAHLQTGRS